MPSTSVHLPPELLKRLDRVAKRRGVTRNRLITEACRLIAGAGRNEWPDDFFASDRLSAKDLEHLRSTFDDWATTIRSARRSKTTAPF